MTHRKLLRRLLLSALLLIPPPAFADELTTEVITLKHRLAAEVLPILKPLIPLPGGVSALDAQLILHATPEKIAEIRALLETIDTPPRQLLIFVRQVTQRSALKDDASLAGEIGTSGGRIIMKSGDPQHQNGVALTHTGKNHQVHTRITQTRNRDDNAQLHTIRVLDGHRALIDTGQSVPITDYAVKATRGGVSVQQHTEYKNITSGFYVVPRVTGDQVTLEITPYQATSRQGTSPDVIETQNMHSTISARLGEWITLGGSLTTELHEKEGWILYRTEGTDRDDRIIEIKVTEAQ